MDLERVDSCPVCGHLGRLPLHTGLTDRVFGIVPGRWDLYRCANCGAAYLDPRPAAHALHEAYASYYTQRAPTTERAPAGALATARRALRNGLINARYGYELHPATRLAPALLATAPRVRGEAERPFRHLPKRSRLLDVGCGAGEFVAHAKLVGWCATGIDVDDRALRGGRAEGYDLRCETLAEHAAGDYDAITLSHVIEHVADPVGLLSAARERLRPDGLLWIATPNMAGLGHRRFRDNWFGLDAPRHLLLFRHHSLQLALTRAGFAALRDAPHTPNATMYFAASAAVGRGQPAGRKDAQIVVSPSTRLLGAVADRAARRDPRLAEELVVLTSPLP